ncbi:MAG: hypothetical protein ACXAEU_25985 [Candidatus Hodarchaeales archaeon]|jgi:hypothetical protein
MCIYLEKTFEELESGNELLTLARFYVLFIREHTNHAEIIDDPNLRSALAKIMEKERTSEELTDSESEFRTWQQRSLELLTRAVALTMTGAGVSTSISSLDVAITLSNLTSGLVKELIIRERLVKQPEKETEDYFTLIFMLIQEGLKHYKEDYPT